MHNSDMKGEWEWEGGGRGLVGSLQAKKLLFCTFSCTRLSLYPNVALVPDCRCTRLSHHLYPFVPVPNCRLPLYPIVPVPNCRQLLYPIVPVPNCRICTRLSLYPTVPIPNCPRTRLSGTGKINDTKNAISHELLGLDLEQNFKKENSWFCMLPSSGDN